MKIEKIKKLATELLKEMEILSWKEYANLNRMTKDDLTSLYNNLKNNTLTIIAEEDDEEDLDEIPKKPVLKFNDF